MSVILMLTFVAVGLSVLFWIDDGMNKEDIL